MEIPAAGPGNVQAYESLAREALEADDYDYLCGGADDMRTVAANAGAYARIGIRARRLVDVATIDPSVEVLGERWGSPVALAPVGFQGMFHADGECETARGAARGGHRMIVSTVSSRAVAEVADTAAGPVWFQLYPTRDRSITADLLDRAAAAGCPVVALTVDVPVLGNRERGGSRLMSMLADGRMTLGNVDDIRTGLTLPDPTLTWDFVDWLRARTSMKILLKGIVTAEDAGLAREHGVDGLIVSNHGGRQEESDRATVDCVAEVVDAVEASMPVLMDGGIRRGTDVFKALALGARAVCIGRPYCWGLAAEGAAGVARVLEILDTELQRIMALAGTPAIPAICRKHLQLP